MRENIINILILLRINKFINKLRNLLELLNVEEMSRASKQKIHFVNQGQGGLIITSNNNDLTKFKLDETSHLKSGTFIDCSGGVEIGRYFHTGRGLTIFSTNHNYNSNISIPYDEHEIIRPVKIGDFVWCGANVTIVPGVEVGEGVVIGSGAVVTQNIPPYAVIGGNPAKVIKYRDIELFNKLKSENKFF
ncbi:acyltransferase [Nubsella zeaxanthinifaciens]|uniref:acyltransferase n=1 Tax=Nubsella zeaxanthinifaciens TaxID=392412 RepID=UPI003D047FBB